MATGGVRGCGGAAWEGQAMSTVAVHVDSKAELTTLLEQWEKEHGSGQDMVPILTRMSELIEKETEEYRKGIQTHLMIDILVELIQSVCWATC